MPSTPATRSRPVPRRTSRYVADLSPEVQWYLDERGYKLEPWQKPLWRTKEPRSVKGAYFDPARVDRVIAAFGQMRHTQGKWAGHPLKPDAWQVAYYLAPVFGWVVQDKFGHVRRIIRSAWIEVPRKNGKTTIASGSGLYLAFGDDEPGAQVLAAAGSRDQAMNAFRPAYLIAGNTPAFKSAGIRANKGEIIRGSDQSFMKPVASIGDLLQGSNPNGYIVDELHVHKTLDVIDALESGTGARDQPLGIIITTADDGGQLTPYAVRRNHVEQLARGSVKSPTEYAVIFGADPLADPFVEETWRSANPGYGVSPTKAFMESEAEKAKASPANLSRFLRLNLNVRTKQETKYIELSAWDRNAGLVSELALRGRTCWGGMDLASVSDLSAVCYLFPNDAGGYKAIWRAWVPADTIPGLDTRTSGAASEWVRQGYLTATPGNVTDYDYIRTQILRDAENFNILSIGFDPYNASHITSQLIEDAVPMVKVRQGFLTLSSPTKQIQRLVLQGKRHAPMFEHGGNPVARWCVDNLAVEIDAAENVKPSKKKAGDKIDLFAAAVNAMSEAMTSSASAYDDGHSLVIA
jgi:phage terminase large subunit-like protein